MSKEERVKKVIANITKDLTDLAEILLSANDTPAVATEDHKRKRKDPNAPKQPPSNFFLFSNSIREQVDKQHPEASFTEKSKIYGARWRKLSEEQKKPFTEQAKKEREKYLKEVAAYEKAHPELAHHSDKKVKKDSVKKESIKKENPTQKKVESAPAPAAAAAAATSSSSSESSSDSDSSSSSSSSSDSDSSSDESD
ncbi:high mobility group protein B2 [Mucor circinelloides 1006PhL]|uniref:High mobility group protein B2 n=1 Tax=Mucor circinelloides f. circinelloides (strain 1006PhL) TaxID=1220926 RepID=S2JQ76_MUCC1|nr:high mobility group protein B2 [Mucor circinelloides 1006PhL]